MCEVFGVLADVKQSMSQTLMFIFRAQEKRNSVLVLLLLNPWLSIFANISKERVYNINIVTTFFTSLRITKKLARNKTIFFVEMMRKKITESENKATYSSNFYWHDPTKLHICENIKQKRKKSVCLPFYHARLNRC